MAHLNWMYEVGVMSDSAVHYRRIVIKLGTSVLTGGSQKLDRAHMVELVRQIAALRRLGCEVVVCSSGAVAAGREQLGYPPLPNTLPNKQMLAAVGQSRLMNTWETLFSLYGLHVGQMLLTRADLDDRERFLNARDTLRTLLDHGIIPIINENDAVATTEIKVGDNDNMSALAAILAEADLLLLLTDQPGLYTADPRSNPDAQLIAEVQTIDETLRRIAGGSVTGLGTGGMATKLQAADVARRGGADVVIASGHTPEAIPRIAAGDAVGTRFPAVMRPLEARKRWLFAAPSVCGCLVVDDGAVKALRERGSSLLPKGIVAVRGDFARGGVVEVRDQSSAAVARGVVRYAAADLEQILGCHSDQINDRLGFDDGSVAIHRDDLVLI